MSKRQGLKKNLAYQTIYQLLNTCIPLITSPYLARVLGATQQGIFSYTQSIVNYFTLFAMLGVVNYGTRTIAGCGEDKKKRSENFWNIYIFQLFLSVIVLIVYGIYILEFCNDNLIISLIQGFYILGSLIDVNWLFFGVEQFEITVKRSIIIRIISLVCILVLVRQPQDLWIYTIIMSGSTVFSNAILWKFLPRIIEFSAIKSVCFDLIKKHIKPNIVLFIPLMAMSVYHIMDKTMLGALSTYEETGFYYNADKVINIPIGIISGVGTVMLPRMSALVENGKNEQSFRLFNISLEMIVCVSTAMAFGIAAISNEFTPLFFGAGFERCILLIIVLAPVLIVKSLSQTSRMQFLVPNHHEKIFMCSVFAGAIVNFIINICLIKQLGALGAVIGTMIAEMVTCVWQYIGMKRYIAVGKTLIKSTVYLIIGIVMYFVVRMIACLLPDSILGVLIEIVVGGIIYLALVMLVWFMFKNPIFSLIKNSIKKGV